MPQETAHRMALVEVSPCRQKYTQKINKQYTNVQKEEKDNQSISNLVCTTDTGIMLNNFTLQDTNALCSST